MTRLLAPLALVQILAGCPAPSVECEWELPDPAGGTLSASQSFQAQILVTSPGGDLEEGDLAAVHFFDGETLLLEGGIAFADACASGCLAGGLVTTPLSPGARTLRAVALTPGGQEACSIDLGVTVNTPPAVIEVTFEPPEPTTDQAVNVIATTEDADGDDVTLSVIFVSPDGATQLDGQLTPINTTAGETWSVRVTPRDALDAGEVFEAEVTIVNTAPGTPEVSIAPVPARTDGAIVCAVTNLDGLDADDDALAVSWSWTVDGADAGVDEPLVHGSATQAGEEWSCTAVANDGTADSAPGSASVTVINDLDLPGSSLELGDLPAVLGQRPSEGLGDLRAVAAPGDMDGDDLDDFLAIANDLATFGDGGGRLYFFSGASGYPSTDTDADTVFEAPDGFILRAPSGVGDINGDGLADLLVGYQQVSGGAAQGAWIIFGDQGGYEAAVPLNADTSVNDGDDRITNIDGVGDAIATRACRVGDLDGDGYDELPIVVPEGGAGRGRLFIVWGHPGVWVEDQPPPLLQPNVELEGQSEGLLLGSACAGPIDLDGNGVDDLVLSAPGGGGGNGRVFVFFMDGERPGQTIPFPADVTIDAAPGSPGGFGANMAALGDHDGDSLPDLAIYGFGPPGASENAGAIWVASGADLSMSGVLDADDLAMRIDGAGTQAFCQTVAGVDLDGDGLGDIACGDGVPANALLTGGTVAARVFLGSNEGLPATASLTDADLLLLPEAPGGLDEDDEVDDFGDHPGASILGAGDLDGDGYHELLIGAPDRANLVAGAGAVYLLDLSD